MSSPHGPTAGAARADAESASGTSRPNGRFTLRRGALGASRQRARSEAAAALDEMRTPPAPYDASAVDWREVGLFGAGILVGALIGASTALLVAPASGFETRMRLVRGAQRAGEQVADRWDDASDRVRLSARRSRQKLERKLTMARWRARDAWERKRYGV